MAPRCLSNTALKTWQSHEGREGSNSLSQYTMRDLRALIQTLTAFDDVIRASKALDVRCGLGRYTTEYASWRQLGLQPTCL